MNKKSIFASIISIILFSVLFGYSLVYAWASFFNYSTNIVFKLSDNIFLDSISLNNTQIVFDSAKDLSKYTIKSKCDIFSKLRYEKGSRYMFDIKFFNNNCNDENLVLVNDKWEVESTFTLNIVREYNALSNLLDIDTLSLQWYDEILKEKVLKYEKYEKYNPEIEENYYTFLKNNRKLKEWIYNENLVKNILTKRTEKYIVPLAGHILPKSLVKIPNSWRWYRSDYTDGIHHWWDIDWNFWDNVLAIDDWIIVRVVNNFKFDDLSKIKRGEKISYDDKVRNLDILRWNQVWLKTMKWDVIFYSHLNEIFTNVKVWEVIKKWQPIGTIWITGVPDKNYKDFHVHFPIHVNPHNNEKIGKYDIDDYMRWDWKFKWKSGSEILKLQYDVFDSK